MDIEALMRLALAEARTTGSDVPVGAVIVNATGQVIASGRNQKENHSDATAHAEIEAIRAAGQILGNWRLDHLAMVVTLEPCPMCAGAIRAARLNKLVIGTSDAKYGAAGSIYDLVRDTRLGPPLQVVWGVLEGECESLVKEFFRIRRVDGRSN